MSATALLIAKVVALVALLAASAFFSGSETALFSLNALQMQSLRDAGGFRARVVALMAKPSRVLSTLLIGNTLVNVVIAGIGYSVVSSIPALRPHATLVSVAVMTAVLLVFGEIAPKRAAVRAPARFAALAAAPVAICFVVFAPLRAALELTSRWLARHLRPERKSLTDEELLTAVEVSAEEGALDSDERQMVDGIMRLSSMTAADVMTPRVDFSGIDLDEPEESYLALVRSSEFRFLPVYTNSPDEIEGFLDVRAYLLDADHDFEKAVRKPVFVPETATLDDLLITMQRSRRHIVCVMDEYGGTAGLVTRGDILEVLTGVMPHDLEERPERQIEETGEGRWVIDGDTSIEEVNHALGLELEAEGADRLSGWIIAQAGRFLRTGESVEAQGCRAKVLKHRKLRIVTVELQVLSDEEEDGDSPAAGTEGGLP